jgi:hypothetical protein
MKEQKNSIGMRKGDNPTTYQNSPPILKLPPSLTLGFKTTFSFQSLCAHVLLCSVLAVIGSLFLITDCSLGYNNAIFLGWFGLL